MDVDLNNFNMESLVDLVNTPEVKGAAELAEWKKVSTVWQSQPPDDRIHLFVKLPLDGEPKPLLRPEHCLEALTCSVVLSLMLQPLAPLSMIQQDTQ